MRRIPLTFRALALVPLFAVLADQVRVAAFCPPGAQSCLEAAGGGLIGPLGLVVLGLYAAGLALLVGRLASKPPTLPKLWLVSSLGILAICGGHALLAHALGDPTAATGWLELLPLIAGAGLLLALAMRIAPAAIELLKALRPKAPRPKHLAAPLRTTPPAHSPAADLVAALTAAGRAPPLTVAQS